MVKIYVSIDKDNYVQAWGEAKYGSITENPDDSYLIELPDNHEFFNGGMGKFRLVNGQLIKDESLALRQAKERKIQELNKDCQEAILAGFKTVSNGINYEISYDIEAQMNLQETDRLFVNNMIESIMWSVGINGKKQRILLNRDQFNKIYLASVKHKQDCISHFRDQLVPIVEQAGSIEAVENINWDVTVIEPSPDPVEFKTDNMLDKQIEELKTSLDKLGLTVDLNGMALVEAINILFTGMI